MMTRKRFMAATSAAALFVLLLLLFQNVFMNQNSAKPAGVAETGKIKPHPAFTNLNPADPAESALSEKAGQGMLIPDEISGGKDSAEDSGFSHEDLDFVGILNRLSAEASLLENKHKHTTNWDPDSIDHMKSVIEAILGPDWVQILVDECAARPGSEEADFVFYLFRVMKNDAALNCALESLKSAGLHRILPNYYLARHADEAAAAGIRAVLSGQPGDFAGTDEDKKLYPLYLAMIKGSGKEASAYFCERAQSADSAEARKSFLEHLFRTANINELGGIMDMLRSDLNAGNRSAMIRVLSRMKGNKDEEVDALIGWIHHEPSPEVRAVIAECIAFKSPSNFNALGTPRSILDKTPAPQAYIPEAAIWGMKRYFDSSWRMLWQGSGDAAYRMRLQPGWTRVVDALSSLLSDPSGEVRKAAAHALARVASKSKRLENAQPVIELIYQMLAFAADNDPRQDVRAEARKQLERARNSKHPW